MANIQPILTQLQTERRRLAGELQELDRAIRAIGDLKLTGSKRPHRLSAAGRKRIADAQRARWAKVRQQQKKS